MHDVHVAYVAPEDTAGAVAVSIVSHGHGLCVQRLLADLASCCAGSALRVVLTQNLPEPVPEPPVSGWPFVLDVRCNAKPAGFGGNHNRALDGATEPWVCVLNPDVRLRSPSPANDPFPALLRAAAQPGVGCVYPQQVDGEGHLQDSERALPTPLALVRRRLLGRREHRADWVNAACLVLPRAVWQTLGGFDERYFMYCEDVDLCLRVRLLGLGLARADAQVVHTGTRASRSRMRHLLWHLASLQRLWRSRAYREGRKLLQAQQAPTGSIRPR